MKKLNFLLFALFLGLAVSITSCSDDNDPVTPDDKTNATIADVKALVGTEIKTIADDLTFDAVVISNYSTKNFYQRVIVQDETGGIELRNYKSKYLEGLALGQKISVSVKDLAIGTYGESIQLGVTFEDKIGGMNDDIANKHITSIDGGVLPEAKIIDLNSLDASLINTLIKIENVQFATSDLSKLTYADKAGNYKFSENRTLINTSKNTILLRTANTSIFSDTEFPKMKGSIVAILGKFADKWQLSINSTDDVVMTEDRFDDGTTEEEVPEPTEPTETDGINAGDTTVSGASDLFISEYVEGASSNKYLEIYNGTGAEVDLSNYTIKLATNGKMFTDDNVGIFALSGMLPNGGVFVIANKGATLTLNSGVKVNTTLEKATYFNGDDTIGLFKGENLIDIFGIEGNDPGKSWKVNGIEGATADHTLVRNSSVVASNTTFTESEWTVKEKEDVSNIGTHKMD